jgi:hypothetical protein
MHVETLSRRELFRRIGRAAIVGPVVLMTREPQADLLYRIAGRFGWRSLIGRWLSGLADWW